MNRSLTILGVAAAALILILVLLNQSERRALSPYQATNFVGADSGAVNKIVVKRMGNDAQLERTGDGWNVMDAGTPRRADKMVVDQIANLAHNLTVGEIISSNAEKQMLFQVDTLLGHTVEFYRDGQMLGNLIVGKAGSDMRSTYVRKPESNDVYLAQASLARLLERPARGFRDKIVSPLDTSTIVMVEVSTKDFKYSMVKVDSIWTVMSGAEPTFVADHMKALQLVGLLGNLRVADFVSDAERDTINMSEVSDQVVVQTRGGEQLTLSLRKKAEGSQDYYIKFSTLQELFTVFEGTRNSLIRKAEEYKQGGA